MKKWKMVWLLGLLSALGGNLYMALHVDGLLNAAIAIGLLVVIGLFVLDDVRHRSV